VLGIEPGPLDLQPGTLTIRPQRRSRIYTFVSALVITNMSDVEEYLLNGLILK
jgi:hypothetical protein